MTTALQLRGHCQCCGRLQAVRGTLAHHGYEVAGYGYFKGTCQGHRHQPIEVDRTVADHIIATVLQDAAENVEMADSIRAGEIKPRMVDTGQTELDAETRKWVAVMVPFAEANLYRQERACAEWADQCEQRARAARSFATYLTQTANNFHGQPLTEVPKAEAPAAIPAGERRVLNPKNGTVGTVRYVERGRVEYSYTNSLGQTFSPSMATRSWRNLPRVTEAGAA